MEKWVNLVETNCADPSREKEFNDWYDNVHVPDVLKTPGFVGVRRYVSEEFQNGRGKYLAIYEIETDDIDKTMAVRREARKKEAEQGRAYTSAIPGLLMSCWRDILFRRVSEHTKQK